MLARIFKVISDGWNRPIYYGGNPKRFGPGRCSHCGAFTDRAEYMRRLQAGADYVRIRDRLDLMTDAELYDYQHAALNKLLREQGVLD